MKVLNFLQNRVKLVSEPTPFRNLNNLSRENESSIYIKEDDVTGICLGGNKVRKLEYLIYDAIQKGADTVITTGGIQSNHARLTTAVARKYGLKSELVLKYGEERSQFRQNGNLLLNNLMDANIHLVTDEFEIQNKIQELETSLKKYGNIPYKIPLGGSNEIGTLGYIRAGKELGEQLEYKDIKNTAVILPVGSGGTMAGLLIAKWIWNLNFKVIGISVTRNSTVMSETVEAIINETLDFLDIKEDFREQNLPKPTIYDDYIGPGYGKTDQQTIESIKLIAKTEGVILDPVYTGKAMTGLLDLTENKIVSNDSIIFLHTGGVPAIFAYQDQL
ncbi:D-cysteine desulfhydrase family protein [Natranaerobius trueperi]|uniref:D-cysteine desulfhydrase family protein n=1 Tax=Natranaerobius trueperi TaxID=759412 RepID=UPI00130398CA|nr:D-cysteine desulfhydrase family protein [Natranaerobius trueperi]